MLLKIFFFPIHWKEYPTTGMESHFFHILMIVWIHDSVTGFTAIHFLCSFVTEVIRPTPDPKGKPRNTQIILSWFMKCFEYNQIQMYCINVLVHIVFTSEDMKCGGELTEPKGEFFSPNYPKNYPIKAKCTWSIKSTGNRIIGLTFPVVK